MNQFGKFQRISSSFDPENPLMDVGNDSVGVAGLGVVKFVGAAGLAVVTVVPPMIRS